MSKTVALDIGHGSNTFPGGKGVYKNGKGYAEHDFNSKLVIVIDKLLKASGVKTVIYQKPYKRDIGLTTRTNYYNRKKVDLVYSIHANASSDSNANGRCVFYWHTAKDSKKLADIVVDEIKKAGYSTHGDGYHASLRGSWTNLHICRETNMTAILVENGFMSGNKDFDLVFGSKQAKYIEDMAQVHAKAICRYFGVKFDGKTNTSSKPSKPSNKPNKSSGKSSNSIVDYLESKGQSSSFSNRKKLAGQYGISNYKGTASQNSSLLKKLRSKDIKKPSSSSISAKGKANMTTNSLVDFLSSIGEPFSFNDRKVLAKKFGVGNGNYIGKANSNAELLKRIRVKYKKAGVINTPKKPVSKPKQSTSSKITLPTGVLKSGSRGEKVKQLQRALNKARFNVGKVDGIYGKKTKDAVTRFQKVHDAYNVDGIYGKRTRSRLSKLV